MNQSKDLPGQARPSSLSAYNEAGADIHKADVKQQLFWSTKQRFGYRKLAKSIDLKSKIRSQGANQALLSADIDSFDPGSDQNQKGHFQALSGGEPACRKDVRPFPSSMAQSRQQPEPMSREASNQAAGRILQSLQYDTKLTRLFSPPVAGRQDLRASGKRSSGLPQNILAPQYQVSSLDHDQNQTALFKISQERSRFRKMQLDNKKRQIEEIKRSKDCDFKEYLVQVAEEGQDIYKAIETNLGQPHCFMQPGQCFENVAKIVNPFLIESQDVGGHQQYSLEARTQENARSRNGLEAFDNLGQATMHTIDAQGSQRTHCPNNQLLETTARSFFSSCQNTTGGEGEVVYETGGSTVYQNNQSTQKSNMHPFETTSREFENDYSKFHQITTNYKNSIDSYVDRYDAANTVRMSADMPKGLDRYLLNALAAPETPDNRTKRSINNKVRESDRLWLRRGLDDQMMGLNVEMDAIHCAQTTDPGTTKANALQAARALSTDQPSTAVTSSQRNMALSKGARRAYQFSQIEAEKVTGSGKEDTMPQTRRPNQEHSHRLATNPRDNSMIEQALKQQDSRPLSNETILQHGGHASMLQHKHEARQKFAVGLSDVNQQRPQTIGCLDSSASMKNRSKQIAKHSNSPNIQLLGPEAEIRGPTKELVQRLEFQKEFRQSILQNDLRQILQANVENQLRNTSLLAPSPFGNRTCTNQLRAKTLKGNKQQIKASCEYNLNQRKSCLIEKFQQHSKMNQYGNAFYEKRQRQQIEEERPMSKDRSNDEPPLSFSQEQSQQPSKASRHQQMSNQQASGSRHQHSTFSESKESFGLSKILNSDDMFIGGRKFEKTFAKAFAIGGMNIKQIGGNIIVEEAVQRRSRARDSEDSQAAEDGEPSEAGAVIDMSPQQLIDFLDEQILKRKDYLKIDIVSEAALKAHETGNTDLYNIDRFQDDVNKFIAKRMKFRFKDKTPLIFQRLGTNSRNCVVQHLPRLRQYNYNQLQEFENQQKNKQEQDDKLDDGDPLECIHRDQPSDLRQDIFLYYTQIVQFCSRFTNIWRERDEKQGEGKYRWLRKGDIVEVLKDKYYDMENLSPDELKLFEDQENGIRMLLNPLLYLVKEEMRQLPEPDKHQQDRIKASQGDNGNQSAYAYDKACYKWVCQNERNLADKQEQQQADANKGRYFYTISPKIQEYLESLCATIPQQVSKDNIDQYGDDAVVQQDEGSYEYVYKQFVQRFAASRDKFDVRSQTIASIARQQQAAGSARLKFNHFANQLETLVSRYSHGPVKGLQDYGDEVPQDSAATGQHGSVGRLESFLRVPSFFEPPQPEKKEVKEPEKVAMRRVGGGGWQAVRARRADLVQPPPPVPEAPKEELPLLSQAQEDIIVDQEKSAQVFTARYEAKKFFEFAKSHSNGCVNSAEEQYMSNLLQEYHQLQAKPSAIFAKIQNNKLILVNEYVSQVDVTILSRYIVWASKDDRLNIKTLELQNCRLPDKQISEILGAIVKQQRIASISILNEHGFDSLSMKPLAEIIARGRPHSLQELSIVGCKMSHDAAFQLLTQLRRGSALSKLTISSTAMFINDTEASAAGRKESAFAQLRRYLASRSTAPEKQRKRQILTHLDLSNNGFTPYHLSAIMESLRTNKTLQFLSLAGNKLSQKLINATQSKYKDDFNDHLKAFVRCNVKNLTHLNLSGMVDALNKAKPPNKLVTTQPYGIAANRVIYLERLLGTICSQSESMQVLHFDDNFVGSDLKMGLASMLGVDHVPLSEVDLTYAPSGQSSAKELEFRAVNFIKRDRINHLIDSNDSIFQQIVDRELYKHCKQSIEHKQDLDVEAKVAVIGGEFTSNVFTMQRNLNLTKFDIKYKPDEFGLMKFYIDSGQISHCWSLAPSHHLCGGRAPSKKTCFLCQNRQNTHIYFSLDSNQVAEGYHEIENERIKQLLKKWFLPRNVESPVILGSLTNWQAYEMLPTQLYVLVLLRDRWTRCSRRSDGDPLTEESFDHYLQILSSRPTDYRIEKLRTEIMPEYHELLNYAQTRFHYAKMRNTNEFGRPQDSSCSISYFAQLWATPGKHSLIVYYPRTDRFFCRNLLVDIRMRGEDLGPKSLVSRKPLDVLAYDPWLPQEYERRRSARAQFLKQMMPSKVKHSLKEEFRFALGHLEGLFRHFSDIDDLFLHLTANQEASDQKDKKETKPAQDDEPPPWAPQKADFHGRAEEQPKDLPLAILAALGEDGEDEPNYMYPYLRGSWIAAYLNQKLVRSTGRHTRQTFQQFIFKQILKGKETKSYFMRDGERKLSDALVEADQESPEGQKVSSKRSEQFTFRKYYDKLHNLDPFTRQWIKYNMRAFRAVFMQYSGQSNVFQSCQWEGDDVSFKNMGYVHLEDVARILEIGDYELPKVQNYLIRLRASVGMNLDLWANEDVNALKPQPKKTYPKGKGGGTDGEQGEDALGLELPSGEPGSPGSPDLKDEHLGQKAKLEAEGAKCQQRSRFFNIDLMEFIQVLIVHTIIDNEQQRPVDYNRMKHWGKQYEPYSKLQGQLYDVLASCPLFQAQIEGSPLPASLVKLVSEAQAQATAKRAAERRKAKARNERVKRAQQAKERGEIVVAEGDDDEEDQEEDPDAPLDFGFDPQEETGALGDREYGEQFYGGDGYVKYKYQTAYRRAGPTPDDDRQPSQCSEE